MSTGFYRKLKLKEQKEKITREDKDIQPAWLVSGRIPCLDGLRALAIMTVIFSHLYAHLGIRALPPLPIFDGHLGVTIFFVLSGFLITLLLLREWELTGTVSLKEFYIRRALRIMPAYLTYIGFVALLTCVGVVFIPLPYWIAALTYTMSFMQELYKGWLLGHTWSLSVEEHFYLIWPAMFIGLRPRRAMQCVMFYVLCTPVLRYIIVKFFPAIISVKFNSLTEMSSIAAGCCLAFVVKGYGFPFLRSVFSRYSLAVILGSTLLMVLSQIGHFSTRYGILFGDPVDSVCTAFLIGGVVYSKDNIFIRSLNAKPVVAVGILSYSLYLWQQPFSGNSVLAKDTSWLVSLILIFSTASLSYLFVETPFLRWKDRRRKYKVRGIDE